MSPLDQPVPTVARFTTLGIPQTATGIYDLPSYIGAGVSIAATKGDRIWFLTITDVSTTNVTHDASLQLVEFTAMDTSQQYANAIVGWDDFPAETEAERIARINDLAGAMVWEQLPSDMPWEDLQIGGWLPDVTWQHFGEVDVPTIYVDGTGYDLETRDAQPVSILELVSEMARTSSGFWESCRTYRTRESLVSATFDPFAVGAYALSYGMTTDLSVVNVYNSITYSNSTTSATSTNGASVSRYGQRPLNMITSLANLSDLQELAAIKSLALADIKQQLTSITLDLASMSRTTADYVAGRTFLDLTEIPAQYGGDDQYLVRGRRWVWGTNTGLLELVLLNRNYFDPLTEWVNLSADTWNTYATPTTKWSDVQ